MENSTVAADSFIDRVTLPISAPSLGGVESLITRPATTSHSGMTSEERSRAGIGEGLIRLSVGLEATEDLIENKTVGLFVQEQVSRANRLFLTAAFRGDNNSAFGANFKHALYPKFSGSWVVNEEPFWRWSSLNTLRLRAAYGRAGKQPDVFAAQRLYLPATGPADVAVVTPQAIGNPDLRPEVSSELEAGFDLGALNDRIGVNFTYYNQVAHDAIVQRQVEPSLGFPGFQYVNAGRVANPMQCRGQVEGGVAQSLGAALYEEMVIDEGGRVVNPKFRDYHVPSFADVPRTEVYFADTSDALGPMGAKSMSESPYNPVAAALGNALADATGIRFTAVPFKPDRLWPLLHEKFGKAE